MAKGDIITYATQVLGAAGADNIVEYQPAAGVETLMIGVITSGYNFNSYFYVKNANYQNLFLSETSGVAAAISKWLSRFGVTNTTWLKMVMHRNDGPRVDEFIYEGVQVK